MGGILLLLLMIKIMLSTWGYSIVVVVNDDNHAIHMGVFYSIDRYEDWHPMSSHAQVVYSWAVQSTVSQCQAL